MYEVWRLLCNQALMCLKVHSVTVGVGTVVRDCRSIGTMGVLCKVGIIDYLVNG
jgi:hypothetical protein